MSDGRYAQPQPSGAGTPGYAPAQAPGYAPAQPPTQQGAPAGQAAPARVATPGGEPESIGALLALLAKQALKTLPLTLGVGLTVFFGVWILHTYLLAGPNGGFDSMASAFPGLAGGIDGVRAWMQNGFLAQVLAVSGGVNGASALWFAFTTLVGAVIGGISRQRSEFFAGLGKAPSRIAAGFSSGTPGMAALLGGAGSGVLLVSVTSNRLLAFVVAILAYLAIGEGESGFSHMVMRCVYNDGRRVISKPRRRMPAVVGDAFVAGVIFGCLVYFSLFFIPWDFLFWGLGFACVLAAIVLAGQASPALAGTAAALLMAAVLVGVRVAFADDGGFEEATGPWILSPGALQAILMGLPPATAAALGAIISILGPTLGGMFVAGILPTLLGPPGANKGTAYHTPGGPGDCAPKGGLPRYSIDTVDLGLHVSDLIHSHDGLGPAVALAMTWNAVPDTGAFGTGWSFAYESRIEATADLVTVFRGDGSRAMFAVRPADAGAAPVIESLSGDGLRLSPVQGAWVLEDLHERLHYRYDPWADGTFRMTAVIDGIGHAVVIGLDAAGRPLTVTDAAGRATTLAYDAYGRCSGLTLPDGRGATFAFGEDGRLAQSVDLAGIETLYGYDAAGMMVWLSVGRERRTTEFGWGPGPAGSRIATVKDPTGAVTHYAVTSEQPRVASVTEAHGATTTYTSENGITTSVTRPDGSTVGAQSSAMGLQASIGPDGAATHIEYDPAGRWARHTDATGAVTTMHYDERGLLIRADVPGGSQVFTYDAAGNLASETTAAGRTTAYAYDERGLLTSVTDPAGGVKRYAYDRFGNVASETDPLGATTAYVHDAWGLRLVEVTDPIGRVTRMEYDGNDRVTKVVSPDGSTETHVYDCCAEIAVSDSDGTSAGLDRDAAMRPLRLSDGRDHVEYSYDAGGRMVGIRDSRGRAASLTLDAIGQAIAVETASGRRETSFDAAGRPVWLRDEVGGQTWLAYDVAGRLTTVTDALGRGTSRSYDGVGLLASLTNARGATTRYSYDPDGAPISRVASDGTEARFGYDPCARPASVEDERGRMDLAHDAAGRLTGLRYPDGLTAGFSYDAAGRVTSMTYPGGARVTFERDASDAPVRIDWDGGWAECVPGAGGLLESERRSNGTSTTYGHSAGDLTRIVHSAGGDEFASIEYEMDASGRVVGVIGSAPSAPGAPTVLAATYDTAGALASLNGAKCGSDADGNLTEVEDGSFRASYDDGSRLVSLVAGAQESHFSYDGLGQRVRVEDGGGAQRVEYRDGEGRLLAEGDGMGKVTAWYVYRDAVLLARVAADGATWFYHGDRTGSVIAVTDETGGVVGSWGYDPYGNITDETGDIDNRFTFVGLHGVERDAPGVYRMGYRHYLAPAGRFVQRDPLGPLAAPNPYSYAGGDPMSAADPLGLMADPGFRPDQLKGMFTNSGPGFFTNPDQATFVQGATNTGVGAFLTGLGAVSLKRMIFAGTASFLGISVSGPVGWGLAIGSIIMGIARWNAGRNNLSGNKTYQSFKDWAFETVDFGGVATWACNVPGRVKKWYNTPAPKQDAWEGSWDKFKHDAGNFLNPSSWMPR